MRSLALLLLAAALPAQSWQPLTPTTSPTPRLHAPAAYDPFRGVTTLFGGDGACTALSDTWEFTGATWTPRLSVVRPSARAGHGFAFDLRRQRAVLFGGLRPGLGVAGDTWEWDGSTWLQRTPATAPPARAFAAMAYDATRGVTVLFGGEGSGGALLGDTWEWDGATWQLRALATAPPARRHAAMAGDEVRRDVVLFGGDDGAQALGDTWTFDGAQWQAKATPQAPGPRQQAALAGDGNFGRLVLLGGLHNGSALADAWAWDGSAWSPLAGAVPPARRGHALAFDAQRGATVCFGGSDTAACSGARADTWELASPAVRQMTVVAPPVVGQTAQFRYDYPAAAGANHFYWHLVTLRQPAAFAVPIPGFPSLGLCRVDLFNLLGDATGFLDGSGQNVLSLAVPNQPAAAGFGFDVQAVDLDFWTMTLRWAENDAETYVLPGVVNPSLNMVAVSAGSFAMGSNVGLANEQPVHQVTLTRPFWISRYEVTQAQYQAVVGTNPSVFQGAGFPNSAALPVDSVSWDDAMAYCEALNAIELAAGRVPAGYQYRLPTEAEWEYCCRAGSVGEWHTGSSLNSAQANIANAVGHTAVGGTYPSNAWGLHDMHGNLQEWCLDAWRGQSNYPSGPVVDPNVQEVGGAAPARVIRGGTWYFQPSECRSAFRASYYSPSTGTHFTGFRVVLAPILVPKIALRMAAIPAGSFMMGSTSGYSDEQPVHSVAISRQFWIGRYEVTQSQYQGLMGGNPSFFQGPGFGNPGDRPVERVTWFDAIAYCQALNAIELAAGRVPPGYQYRLPTEAEWEYCCRATSVTEWNTGASITTNDANFANHLSQPVPVGGYQMNAWGLYDMHGNVWEWCMDTYGPYVLGSVVDPYVFGGATNVLRGGGWSVLSSAFDVRSARRLGGYGPSHASDSVGFRIVLGRILP